VKKDKLTPLWTSLISLKRHTPSHNTLLYIIKMFSVTQTVTQSVRLNATVSKRDVTRRYEEVLLLKVFSVRVGSIIHFVLFYLSSFRYTSFFPLHARMLSGARAREGERRLHSSRLQTPFAVKASFVPSFRRKERVNKVWYLSRRDMDNWKE